MRSGRLLGITHGGRAGASGSGVVRVIGPGNDHTRIRSYHPAGIRRQRYLQARSKKSFSDRPTRSGARRPSWAARTPSADATGRSCAQSRRAEPSSAWAPSRTCSSTAAAAATSPPPTAWFARDWSPPRRSSSSASASPPPSPRQAGPQRPRNL